jgi:hypothetical protein
VLVDVQLPLLPVGTEVVAFLVAAYLQIEVPIEHPLERLKLLLHCT